MKGIKDSFRSIFKLVNPNKKYDPIIAASFYHIVGACLLEHPITIKKLNIDMRFSFGCCITSGLGKEAIGSVIVSTANSLGMKVSSFTSLHEEQLVGKRWYDKAANETKEILGYFNDNFLSRDDALTFLNSPKYEEARNYFLPALNVWGKNNIKKKLVEDEKGLNYPAKCSFLYFIQPSEKIIIKNLAGGLFRRAPVLRVDFAKEEVKEILRRRVEDDFHEEPEVFLEFLRFIRSIRSLVYKPILSELMQRINDVTGELIDREDPLLSTIIIANQNNIIKFSYIHALLRLKPQILNPETIELEPIGEDVEAAIHAYKLIYQGILNFVVANKTGGKIELHRIKEEILQLLEEKECFSQESSTLSTSKVINMIVEKTGQGWSTVNYHFYKLRNEGKIKSIQEGQYGGKVWLNQTNS